MVEIVPWPHLLIKMPLVMSHSLLFHMLSTWLQGLQEPRERLAVLHLQKGSVLLNLGWHTACQRPEVQGVG